MKKRVVAIALAIVCSAAVIAAYGEESAYDRPADYHEDGSIDFEPGTFIVEEGGPVPGSIPPGLYAVESDGFNGTVFLQANAVFTIKEGFAKLRPVYDVSFTADSGEYVVGVDFPSGNYSIDPPADGLCVVVIRDAEGTHIRSESLSSSKGDRIGKIALQDGYTVQITSGAAHFGTANGITFE